jgi:hypothetical protein
MSHRWATFPVSMMPSRRGRRAVAVVAAFVAASFLQLEVAGTWSLMASARAQSAGEGRRLALFVVAKDAKKDGTTAMVIRGLLRGAADRMQGSGLRRAPLSESLPDAALATVKAKVEAGYAALNAQKWDDAMTLYKDAEAALQPVLGLADKALVARTYKGLGIASLQARKQLQAKESVRRSVLIFGGQKQSEYAFNLESRNLFAQVQREMEEAPESSIEINAVANAEVYVGGEFRGFAPIKVGPLKLGEHLITVFADGYERWSKFVPVRGGPEQRVDVDLKAAGNQKALEDGLASVVKGIDKGVPSAEAKVLADRAGATDVLVLRVAGEKKGFGLQGVYWRGGTARAVKQDLARDATLVSGLQDLLRDLTGVAPASEAAMAQLEAPPLAVPEAGSGGAAVVGGGAAGGEDLMVDPNSPIFKDTGKKPKEFSVVNKWWFWTALIVGAGAIAGVTYWGVTSGGGGGGGGPTGDLKITLRGVQ